MSPTFVDDIALQPMLEGEARLWTEKGTLDVVVQSDIPQGADSCQRWPYKVRRDMRLGDFKRLVLWQKPEPFIVNHLVNNSEKLEDIFARHGGSNVLNFQYDLRKYFLFIYNKEDGELDMTLKESSA